MSVKLVSYSRAANSSSIHFSSDSRADITNLVSYCARVSNPSNQNNEETSKKLIKYLIKNKHWSPLEMVSVCLEIETTRDIARQILRHRSFSFQEFSQRYADPTKDLQFVTREARLQDSKNRQNSIELDDESELHHAWKAKQELIIHESKMAYDWAINNGIAKEQARAVLPEGLTMSRMYMNIELRTGNGTQKEHMDIAKDCAFEIAKVFPLLNEVI